MLRNRFNVVIVVFVALAILLAACSPQAAPVAAPASEAPQATPVAGATNKPSTGTGSGTGSGVFQGFGELTLEQAAVKYRADAKALASEVSIPQGDPFESISSLSSHGLDKAALQAALTKLGKTDNPDAVALDAKRQQDFDALLALANTQYKTALVSSNQKDTEKATKSVTELAKYWKDVSDLYGRSAPQVFAKDTGWSADLARIIKTVNTAKDAIAKGDLAAGHAAMEPVREILLQVRTRNNAQVFGDKLTIFHAAMEAVTTPPTGKTVDTLSDADIAAVKAATAKMAETWQPIATPPSGLTAEQTTAYQGLAQAQAANLAALDKALTTGDKAGIVQAAGDIKATFTKLFVQFG
jgi:hypothetical protein